MGELISFIPVTQREEQIVKTLGNEDWEVLERSDSVSCLNENAGILIKKDGHTRWIKATQEKLKWTK